MNDYADYCQSLTSRWRAAAYCTVCGEETEIGVTEELGGQFADEDDCRYCGGELSDSPSYCTVCEEKLLDCECVDVVRRHLFCSIEVLRSHQHTGWPIK